MYYHSFVLLVCAVDGCGQGALDRNRQAELTESEIRMANKKPETEFPRADSGKTGELHPGNNPRLTKASNNEPGNALPKGKLPNTR